MKKCLTVAALLVAGTALASAAETLFLFTDADYNGNPAVLPTSLYKENGVSSNLSGINTTSGTYAEVTASDVVTLMTTSWSETSLNTGWYLGSGTGVALNGWDTTEPQLVSTDGTANFRTTARIGYKSNYVAFIYNLNDLASDLSGSYTEADSLTVTLNYSVGGNDAAQITLWYYDGSSAVALDDKPADGTLCGSFDYTTGGSIIALFSNSSTSAGATYSNVSLTATIPEPSAFGLLAGAGAFALVASRRRRK